MFIQTIQEITSTQTKYEYKCSSCQKECCSWGHYLKKKNNLLCGICQSKQSKKDNAVLRLNQTFEYTCDHCKRKFERKNPFGKNQDLILCPSCRKIYRSNKKLNTVNSKYGSWEEFQKIRLKSYADTNLQRYGHISPFHKEGVQEKVRNTCLEKYGVDNPWKNKIIHQKTIDGMTATYRKKRIDKFSRMDFSSRGLQFFVKKDIPYFRCITCGDEWEAFYQPFYFSLRCLKCFPLGTLNTSMVEKDFMNFISSLNNTFTYNDRTILKDGKELDCYSSSLNLAFEFDGIYWHSELQGKDKYYHLRKTNECKEKGIQLIHVFENEWVNKPQLVKNIIASKINQTNKKIYARDCEIKEIDVISYQQFCDDNHIQGGFVSSIRLGLFYKYNLCQVMGFSKSRFDSRFEYELVRSCSLQEYTVVGGASKLLSYFEENYNPKNIISYCDKRWFTGNSYLKMGFTLKGNTQPSYYYFKHNLDLIPRQNFMKAKLKHMDGFIFDENLTEWENMQLNKWNRIWDCGQLIFIKEYKEC